MADARSRGGKKAGRTRDKMSDEQQGTGARRRGEKAVEGVAQRPAEGQPGGPKPGPKRGRSRKDASEQ